MPVVDITGVGNARFPDEMPPNDIRDFLRSKFSDLSAAPDRASLFPTDPNQIESNRLARVQQETQQTQAERFADPT